MKKIASLLFALIFIFSFSPSQTYAFEEIERGNSIEFIENQRLEAIESVRQQLIEQGHPEQLPFYIEAINDIAQSELRNLETENVSIYSTVNYSNGAIAYKKTSYNTATYNHIPHSHLQSYINGRSSDKLKNATVNSVLRLISNQSTTAKLIRFIRVFNTATLTYHKNAGNSVIHMVNVDHTNADITTSGYFKWNNATYINTSIYNGVVRN